jgi:hypothetical protein
MENSWNPSRRTVLKMAWGAVTVTVTPVSALGWRCDGQKVAAPLGNGSWSGEAGRARYRIDGLAKVLGRKLYARDFRARDMPGWPAQEKVGMVLHATQVDRALKGLDLSMLPVALRPEKIIDASILKQDKIQTLFPDTSPSDRRLGFMAEPGKAPGYFGQPVAILIFASAEVYREAYRILQFNSSVVTYGDPVPPPSDEQPSRTRMPPCRSRWIQRQERRAR